MRRIVTVVAAVSSASTCVVAAIAAQWAFAPRATDAVGQPVASCAGRVLDDWVDDGRVQGTYRLQCFRAALRALPEDLRAYSSAPDDLARAMQSAGHSPS